MKKKDWTILIYANGNNELEPEIWNSIIALQSADIDENINVIVQIARESLDLVRIIRPFDDIETTCNTWAGVRRYKITAAEFKLIDNFKNLNMADHHNLYEFIRWGVSSYPAKHFILILSGHGASYITALPDYSQEVPVMMSTYDMCETINKIYLHTGTQIDVLILDICSMNQIDIIYQLARRKQNTVKYLLTYIGDGPIAGIPYGKVIESTKSAIQSDDIKLILINIINSLNINLVAIAVDHYKLNQIKEYSQKINKFDSSKTRINDSTALIDFLSEEATPRNQETIDLENAISSLVIYSNHLSSESKELIDMGAMHISISNLVNEITANHTILNFDNERSWIDMLNNNMGESPITNIVHPQKSHLVVLTRQGLKKVISAANPILVQEEIDLILNQLLAYKKWAI